jgi:hypothetical protein
VQQVLQVQQIEQLQAVEAQKQLSVEEVENSLQQQQKAPETTVVGQFTLD